MIARPLPVSIVVDVCWHDGRLVVVRQSGSTLVIESFAPDLTEHQTILRVAVAGNAAARVASFGGACWLAYRDGLDLGHLVRLDTGESFDLGPAFGQRPFAFGAGRLAWLARPTLAWLMGIGAGVGAAQPVHFPESVATGLSHIDDAGGVVTWEAMRQAATFAAGFVRSGPFLIGEDFGGDGLRGSVDGSSGRLHLWPGEPLHDPRIAVQDSRCAVVAWASGSRPAQLGIVTAADVVAEPAQPAPQPPTPNPEPSTPEPTMLSVPDHAAEAAAFLATRLKHFPGDHVSTSVATFAAVNALCVELRKSDSRWFLLVKEAGQNNVRLRGVDVLLYQVSPTEAQVVDVVSDGDGHDGPPRPSWQPKDIRPIEQAREPFTDAAPAEPAEPGRPGPSPAPAGSLDLGPAVAALIAAAVAPLRAEIAQLRAALEERQAPGAIAGRIALRSSHGRFLSIQEDGRVIADRVNAGEWEFLEVIPE